MLEQNNDSSKQNTASQGLDTSAKKTRRSFLKKAAISAPILTTIAARPVWAGRCSLSGNLSNNASDQANQEPCSYSAYSPGGWLTGRASGFAGPNPDLWPYTGFTRNDPLSDLLPGTSFNGSIASALDGGPHGWERQAACAALNAALWEYGLATCENDPDCNIMTYLASGFYFPFTLAEIQDIYADGPNSTQESAWEAMQNID